MLTIKNMKIKEKYMKRKRGLEVRTEERKGLTKKKSLSTTKIRT